MLFLHQGDIVFAPFPHEDERDVFDKRPCLVLSVDIDNERFIAAKITTTNLNRYWAFHLNPGRQDTSSGKILKESWINLNRREWIDFKDCIYVLARVKDEIFNQILERMDNLAKI